MLDRYNVGNQSNGSNDEGSSNVFSIIGPTTAPTLSFTASPGSITSGQSSTLNWSSTNATSCTASGGWTGAKSVSGSQVVSPSATTTYTLSCSGTGGSVTQSVTVTVATTPPSIAISYPVATGGTYSTGTATVNVSGTASDNVGVVSVIWDNNRGGGGTASGTTNWSATGIALQSGANIITVHAYDAAGNTQTASITVNYTTVTTGNLTVTVRRSDTNALLSGARLLISGPNSIEQTTGSDGTTTFRDITIGSYTVQAWLEGYQENSAPATVVANTTTQVPLLLTPIPQAKKRVVILIHGIAGSPGSFGLMADFLRSTGKFEVFYFNYHVLSNAGGILMNRVLDTPIQDIATYFKVLCINNIKKGKLCASPGQDPDQAGPIGDDVDTSSVDIVAHSMGGLVALSYISGLTDFPYGNDVGKVVTLGTPFFGGHFSYFFGWGGKQVEEMEFASQFLWDLQQAWKNTLDLGRYKKADILNVVGTLDSQAFPDSDTVVPVVSAVLPDLDIRSRYVPKCHATIVPNCSNDVIAYVDTASHPSYQLVESFLRDKSDPQNCPECSKTPPTTTGNLFVRFVEKDDPTIGIPVSEYADDKVLTFDPDPNASLQFDGRARGTLLVQGLPAQSYTPTVDGRKFYREVDLTAPRYVAPFLPPISINAGRTTVLPQIELRKTENNYTVVLAVAKAAWVAGKDIFDLAVQLCCTIPTAQSNSYQSLTSAALSQSTLIDGYIWTEIPGGGRFFLHLQPDFINFNEQRTPVVSSFPIENFAGSVLSMPIPADLPTGTYTFFVVGVVPGSDPLNSANWVTNRAELSVTLTK